MYLCNSKARTTGNMPTGYCSNLLYQFAECSHEQIVNYLEETKKNLYLFFLEIRIS